MVIILKKNNTNQNNIDSLKLDLSLILPNLSTAQKQIQTSQNGEIYYDTTQNKLFATISGTDTEITTGASASGFVTLATAQTITGTKTFQTSAAGDLDVVILENTFYNGTNGADLGITFRVPNVASTNSLRSRSFYLEGANGNKFCMFDFQSGRVFCEFEDNTLTNVNINLPVAGSTYKIQNNDVLTASTVLPNSTDSNFNNNMRLTATGLRLGNTSAPTSLLHLNSTNPTIQVEGTGTASINMLGATNNNIDMNINDIDIHTETGSALLEFRQNGQKFVTFDSNNKAVVIGAGVGLLPNLALQISAGINEDKAILLPRLSSAGETTLQGVLSAPSYNGAMWYSDNDNEFKGYINGTVHVLYGTHSDPGDLVTTTNVVTLQNKTMDISNINADNNTITNIANDEIKAGAAIDATKIANGTVDNGEFQQLNGITSQVCSINDTQTITNKTLTSCNVSTPGFFDVCFTSGAKELRVCGNTPNGSPFITMISNFGGAQQFYFQSINSTNGALQFLDSSKVVFIECDQAGTFNLPKGGSKYQIAGVDVESVTQTLTNKSIDADNNTITNIDNNEIKAAAAIDATKLANGTVDNTEFQTLNGVTSSIQTQLDSKISASGTDTLTNKTIAFGSNTLTDVASTNTAQTLTNKTLTSCNVSTPGFFDVCFTTGLKELRVCSNTPNGSPLITMISNFGGGGQQFYYQSINSTNGAVQFLDQSQTAIIECDLAGTFNLPKVASKYQIGGTDVLNATTLGSGVINSSIQNTSSDILEINGQTNTDCVFRLNRGGGSFFIDARVNSSGSYSIFNNAKELMVLDGQFLSLNSNMTVRSQTTNLINTQICSSFSTASNSYQEACTVFYRVNYPWSNAKFLINPAGLTMSVRIFSLTAATTVGEVTGVTGGTNVIQDVALTNPVGSVQVYAIQIKKDTVGGGNVGFKGILFD